MEFHQIRYFLALADTLNFTRAAELCNVSQPSLTRAVRKLEDELGGALVFRERSNSHLTELGRVMVPKLREIFERAEQVTEVAGAFHQQSVASVRVAVSHSIDPHLLAYPLRELSRAVPELEIQLERLKPDEIVLSLREGLADMAVAGDINEEWDRLDKWTLFEEGFSVVLPVNHPMSGRHVIHGYELDALGLLARGFCEDARPFLHAIDTDSAEMRSKHQVSTENDLVAFVEAGFGCAVVPNSTHTPPGLARIPLSTNEAMRSVNLFTVSGRQRSPACSTLVKLLRAIDWSMRIEQGLAS